MLRPRLRRHRTSVHRIGACHLKRRAGGRVAAENHTLFVRETKRVGESPDCFSLAFSMWPGSATRLPRDLLVINKCLGGTHPWPMLGLDLYIAETFLIVSQPPTTSTAAGPRSSGPQEP